MTFTTDQVAELGEMIRPFLAGEPTMESVTTAAEAARSSWDDFADRALASSHRLEGGPRALHATFAGLLEHLGGTYDEFRAEAGVTA